MTITARYNGQCRTCGGSVEAGDRVDWDRGTKSVAHEECPTQEAATPAPFSLSGGSGYGCQGWQEGDVVLTSKRLQEERGYPEFVYVLRSGSDYYREEGMSFGVGDESGRRFWAEGREATEEETAPIRAAMARREAADNAVQELRLMVDTAFRTWERPEGDNPMPIGEVLCPADLDSRIYGGGSWWVVTATHVWYVLNNGHDGDDWAQNNLGTGGAGAIGVRTERTEELVATLRKLGEITGREGID